ncbi:MAG: indole-3-glycerol-phosphate synthase, partial [Crenarchaeota archaeon]|nr:indole-3-glycerol-phosphate synthase [Thermoproteota archaeon]
LDILAQDAKKTINSKYYEKNDQATPTKHSLKEAILHAKKAPIIAELKAASPSKGAIRNQLNIEEISRALVKGGAVGISVLTEPKHFNGSLENLTKMRKLTNLPILMKDFILESSQLDAATKAGANAVLLIQALFDRGYCDKTAEEMISEAHSKKLEVLLETHNQKEFTHAIETKADLIGINNRNLGTLKIDLNVTKNILNQNSTLNKKIIVSESGINTPSDLRFLQTCGAKAFLIGSAIMQAENIEEKVSEFVNT